MTNVVVVGSQWGDEGKGKIVDWLSEQADVVIRFQGGHNAGHTLVINGKVFRLESLHVIYKNYHKVKYVNLIMRPKLLLINGNRRSKYICHRIM